MINMELHLYNSCSITDIQLVSLFSRTKKWGWKLYSLKTSSSTSILFATHVVQQRK